jgi:hypothetical protein
LEGFCHSNDALVGVVDDAPLLIERTLQVRGVGRVILDLLAEIFVGLLETLAVAIAIAEDLTGKEAELYPRRDRSPAPRR